MRLLLAAIGCACLGAPAAAHPYSLDDMLALEGYGQVLVAPDGDRVLVERHGRYDGAARFSYGYQVRRLVSRVMLSDMATGAALVPAFPQERGAGYWAGAFAPAGGRVTVFRLKDDRLRLGVADLDRRSVRWFAGAPDLPIAAPAPVWLDARHILYLRFAEDRLPFVLDHPGVVQKMLAPRWRAQARGKAPSADVARTRGIRPRDPRDERLLVEVDVTTGRERILARGAFLDLLVSPVHDRAALILSGERVQPDPETPIASDYVPERRRLEMVDLSSGRIGHPCPACDVAPRPLSFSATGDLAFRARLDGTPWAKAHLFVVGQKRALVDLGEGAADRQAAWIGFSLLAAGDGGRWSCRSCSTAIARAMGALPPGAALVANDGRAAWFAGADGLERLDPATGPTRIVDGPIMATGLDLLDPASTGTRALRMPPAPLVRQRAGDGERVVFGADASLLQALGLPNGAAVLATSRKTGSAIGLVTDDHGVGSLLLLRPRAAPKVIDQISRHLAQVDLPLARRIERRGAGGATLSDWLFSPRSGRRHPLVVIPYQGSVWGEAIPSEARPQYFGAMTNVMLLVAKGYAVLLPSLPAGPRQAPQTTLVGDLDKALDAAIATGLADPARIALLGHSYGGVNALYIAAHSRRFGAVIAASGASDLAAAYGMLAPAERVTMDGAVPLGAAAGWSETGQGGFGAPPWEAPERYLSASSFFSADRITAPLLLTGGDIDYVPMEQAERLFVSLDRLGRDVTLARYFGEGHVIQSPANIRHYWETILAFLTRTMGPATGAPADGPVPKAAAS